MSSRLKAVAAAVVMMVAVCSCRTLRPRTTSDLSNSNERQTGLGLIEHRGEFYRVEDLNDPNYRAASNDPFVRGFMGSPSYVAWAGIVGEEQEPGRHRQLLLKEAWAGMNPADHQP